VGALVALATGAGPCAAQLDYRNLDDHRPVRSEDAYAIERHAFEWMLPAEYETRADGELAMLEPELAYGVFANAQVGVKLPFVAGDAATEGFAGPRLFGLFNFNTESASLPGLSLRADVTLPWGPAAGDAATVFLKGIATRGWGLTRVHLNLGATVSRLEADRASASEPQWAATVAVDRTLLRQSVLLVGELAVTQAAATEPTEVVLSAGARVQLTPTLVLDGGLARRLTEDGPDVGVTLGLTHVFGVAALVPARSR